MTTEAAAAAVVGSCPTCGGSAQFLDSPAGLIVRHVALDQLGPKPYSGWVELELLGRHRVLGLLSEEEIAGSKLFRIDVPEVDGRPAEVHFYSRAAIYGIHPTTEDRVREELSPRPGVLDFGVDERPGGDLDDLPF